MVGANDVPRRRGRESPARDAPRACEVMPGESSPMVPRAGGARRGAGDPAAARARERDITIGGERRRPVRA
jgi:hypothetical protein